MNRRVRNCILSILLVLVLTVTSGISVSAANLAPDSELPLWIRINREYQRVANQDAYNRNTSNYGCTEIDDIDYVGDRSEMHLLDVYSPSGTKKSDRLPVIVDVHGGGYTTGKKEINRQQGLYLASLGFRVVNVNYTLVPEGTMVQEMKELETVFKWIEDHAELYGFDENNIFITGDSSGGHLVLLFAATQRSTEYQDMFDIVPSRGFRAVAATCPCGSFTTKKLASRGVTLLLTYGSDFMEKNDAVALSYDHFLKETQPPTFIITSRGDTFVYSTTREIHDYMEEQGISHKYKEYSNGTPNTLGHVFNVTSADLPESMQANQDIAAFFRSNMGS